MIRSIIIINGNFYVFKKTYREKVEDFKVGKKYKDGSVLICKYDVSDANCQTAGKIIIN